MKLKRHIKNHSLIHNSNSSKLKIKGYSSNNLQLVKKNVYLFQKVEDDIRRNLFEQHLQRIYIKVLFSAINQMRTKS